ncbi:MAG: hypothetical protein ACREMO_01250 [Gemmatimonadales bacterium]
MTVAAVTAEWICTQCGSTNRRLVPATTDRTTDRCVSCHTPHLVEPGTRPVRWEARKAD